MLEHALNYARHGFHVLPLIIKTYKDKDGNTKKANIPPFKGGFHNATTDEEQIRKWWKKNPNYNIGIRTGKESGIVVIDVDPRNGGHISLENHDIPDTVQSITGGGGSHYLFKYSDKYSKSGEIEKGIDLKSDGGYIVAPPSIHHYSGKAYEWLTDQAPGEIDLAEIPASFPPRTHSPKPKKPLIHSDDVHLPITQVIEGLGLVDAGEELIGEHPVHGSTTGTNFKVNPQKNVWHCHRCNTGGGPLSLVAVLEGILDCSQAVSGGLRGEDFKNVVEVVKEKYGVDINEIYKEEEKIDTSLWIAKKILEDNTIIWCYDAREFLTYREGYYQSIPNESVHNIIIHQPHGSKYSTNLRNKIVENIRALSHKSIADFNQSDVINFENGNFNSQTKEFKKHSPEILCNVRIPYKYDATATCPEWIKTISEIFENDHNRIKTLQEFFGYCFVSHCYYEKVLFLVGEGSNGKGVITQTLNKLIGKENCASCSLDSLSTPEGRAMLVNKKVNIQTEISKRAERFEEAIKVIASGEECEINDKYVKRYTAALNCKLLFCANKLPRIDDASDGFYRRLLAIYMPKQFLTDESQDTKLKLKLEKELPGIFNWAMQGRDRLEDRGRFEVDTYMTQYIEETRFSNNPILQFQHDCVVFDKSEDNYISKNEMYNTYRKWCEESGHRAMSKNNFGVQFHELFLHWTDKNKRLGEDRICVWTNARFRRETESGPEFIHEDGSSGLRNDKKFGDHNTTTLDFNSFDWDS